MNLLPCPRPITLRGALTLALVQVLVVLALVVLLLTAAWQRIPPPCYVEVAPQTYAGPCVEEGGPWSWLWAVLS